MQTIVSRETSPLSSFVISVTQLKGGDAHNIIPDNAFLGGTLRALTMSEYERGKTRLAEVAEAVAKAHRCTVTIDWDRSSGYPPTSNHAVAWDFAKSVAQRCSPLWMLVAAILNCFCLCNSRTLYQTFVAKFLGT
jgi:IAA-amino acid hydrolase